MSLNISSKTLEVAKVILEIETAKLSPRKRKNLQKMINTGIVMGESTTASVARKILHQKGETYINMLDYGLTFHRPDQYKQQLAEFGKALEVEFTKIVLKDPNDYCTATFTSYRKQTLEEIYNPTNNPLSVYGHIFGVRQKKLNELAKNIKLTINDPTIPDVVRVEYGYEDRNSSI